MLSAALALAIGVQVVAQQPAPARPRITGVSHAGIRVSDAAAARRFYGELLGLPEGAKRTDGRFVYVIGRQHVLIEPGLPADEDERFSHVAFATPDLEALRAHLTSRGVAMTQPPDRCAPSAFRVIDPDGHPIEFVPAEFPPPPEVAAPSAAMSNRLLHAGLFVRDEAAAHKFYRDVLAFSEIWRGGRTEGITSWVNMRVPDGTDYLEYMLVTATPDRRQRGTQHHICLRVPDIQTAWELAARRAGATRLSPPNVGVNGKWQLNLYDPDGTRVELMEPFRTR